MRSFKQTCLAVLVVLTTLGAAPCAFADDAALKKMQEATGITFTVPAGLEQEVRPDGEVQYFEGDKLFIGLRAMADVDQALQLGLARLRGIDKSLKDPEVRDTNIEGLALKVAKGDLTINGQLQQFMVLGLDGGKKTLQIVLMGKDLRNNKKAEALVNSLKRQ